MKAVFLIIDYVPHQVLSIRTLVEKHRMQVKAFHVARFHNFIPNDLINFTTQAYNTLSKQEILRTVEEFNPDVVISAGWMIPEYNWVCKQLKGKTNIPIVAVSDTQWKGTVRQRVNTLISPFHLKKSFTHIWVAGIRQYDYARKLGFNNNQIILNSLTANTEIFSKVDIEAKSGNYPKNFLFIGNFLELKGLSNLIAAWTGISDKKEWTFTVVGKGEMKDKLLSTGQFIVKDYMSQDLLLKEMESSGCFILPSLNEQWALVIHEAVSAGLPILCTKTCGAAPHFVIDKYNGYKIENDSVEDLKAKMEWIMSLDTATLLEFSRRSRRLSNSFNPEIQAASLLQLIKQ